MADSPQSTPRWRRYLYRLIAGEISTFARYYDRLVQWRPRDEDDGLLRSLIDCPETRVGDDLPALLDGAGPRPLVLINGNLNHDYDIEATLARVADALPRGGRVVAVLYNPYLRGLYALASRLGLRRGPVPDTFVTLADLRNLLRLAGLEWVRYRPVAYLPTSFFGLGTLVNRLLASLPLIRHLGLASVVVLRPRQPAPPDPPPSLSIVIPARNEKGNIAAALERMPDFGGAAIEVIFVEGHSTDGTWEEIQRVMAEVETPFPVRAFQQKGKGKSDAVRLGFAEARLDLLTILDADLTMPPELLVRFYDAYRRGLADFVNGSRLVYPMEGEAMRFLNHLGNIFFAKALSWVLDNRLSDSLCGTKLLSRDDYARLTRWRHDFGDVDPFGDFELLFPASTLALGTVDVPIRYRDRTYGSTNISRFRHGFQLLRMTSIGWLRIKLGARPVKERHA